jgi:uncharacterized membrane protein
VADAGSFAHRNLFKVEHYPWFLGKFMNNEKARLFSEKKSSVASTDSRPMDQPGPAENDQINQNIHTVMDFYSREDEKISYWQRALERLSCTIGQPAFLGLILLFVTFWALGNTSMKWLGLTEFDPPPFFWLQGIVGLAALLITTIVLTRQNRLAKLEEQRAHLDLKVTLLTEQKAAKLIDLIEELRRDLPNVKNRLDTEAVALQQSMNPDLVLAALDERATLDEASNMARKPDAPSSTS